MNTNDNDGIIDNNSNSANQQYQHSSQHTAKTKPEINCKNQQSTTKNQHQHQQQ